MSQLLNSRWFRLGAVVAFCVGFCARAATFDNVTVANVTPSSFSVIWQGTGTPGIEVFANAAGTSNLIGTVSVESFPLLTGNATLQTAYERRQNQGALRANGRAASLAYLRVGNLRPATTYYFRLSSTLGNNPAEYHPAAGLLNVTTPPANSFVRSSEQLVIDVPGIDNDGRIVTLVHSNSAYALAAVVGDAAGTNQVFFSISDLLNQAGDANFSATGSQEFSVDLWGPGGGHAVQNFTLVLENAFQIAQALYSSFGLEFGSIGLGSTIVQAGTVGSVPLMFNSSLGVAEIYCEVQLPTDKLVNLALSNRAAAIGFVTISSNSPTTAIIGIEANAGQTFTGPMQLGNLTFTARSNQPSAFVDLKFGAPLLIKPSALPLSNVVAQAGRVVVVGAEPLLEMDNLAGSRRVKMYGLPWMSYGIEYSTNMASPANWTFYRHIPMTNLVVTLDNLHSTLGTVFYRAYEFKADPPIVEALRGANGSRRLIAFGQPGVTYRVQSATGIPSISWSNVTQYTMTNSFRYVDGLGSNVTTVFYRLQKN